MKRQYLSKKVLCLLVFILSFTLNAQEKFLTYQEAASWTLSFPITQNGVTLSTSGTISNKNATPACVNASPAFEVSGLTKTYMLDLQTAANINVDAGAGNAISNVKVLLSRNSTGTTVSQIGHAAFSVDNITFAEYTNVSADGYDYCDELSFTPSGTNYRYFSLGRGAIGGTSPSANAESRVYYVIVTLAGVTTPTISASPVITGLYFNKAGAIDAVGGNPDKSSFTLTGLNLTSAVTVNAPAKFQVSLTGTTLWGNTVNVSPSSGSISQPIYVRIDPTASHNGGDTPSGNVNFTSGDVATISPLAVSGTVVDLTPLLPTTVTVDAPSVTFSGADISWVNIPNNNGYLVKIYKAGVQVGATIDLAANTTSYSISGLDELTTYTVRVTTKGNGTSSGNSLESTAQSFTTLAAPPSGKTVCLTEDFESLVPSGVDNSNNCPADGTIPTNNLRLGGTNKCNIATLALPSGTWPNATLIGANTTANSGTRSVYLYRGGVLTLPVVDNPKTFTFYVYTINSLAASTTARGFQVLVDGVVQTSGVYVNDVLITSSTTVVPSFSSENNGTIRGVTGQWVKVSLDISATTLKTVAIQTIAGNGASDIYIDDVTVECSSMELTATPNVAGMNYVLDLGPSATKTFTVAGFDLPNATGNITISNLGDFELSLDNGVTWSNGAASVLLPYTSNTFAKSVMVRLMKNKAVASYSTTLAFACAGYTKALPTLSLSGKVTLLPNTIPCGEEITALNFKGSDENAILLDAITGTNWTAAVNKKNNHFLLKKSATLSSPTISLSEYDLKEVTFYCQPAGSSASNSFSMSAFGSGGSFSPVTFTVPTVQPYTFTQDLSKTGFTGNFFLSFTDGNQNDIEMWDIVLTVVPKKQINLSTATLYDFESFSTDCPSASQSFLILGTCLDDNSSINLKSTLYEFSLDATTWVAADVNNVSKLTYTGSFPVGGMKVFVRQKGTAATSAFNATETVQITNDGVGSASILLSGTVTPPSDIQVPAIVDFASLSGVSSIRSIPIVGGVSCNPLVVSSNCASLTLANCEGGTYGATTSFAVDDSVRSLYLKYTPGVDLNCTITLTSGTFTKTINLNWKGAASITNGVATDNTNVVYKAVDGFGVTNVWKAGALSDATVVTITSANFDVSMGNPTYGDFVATTSVKLGDLKGTLYIKQKAAATSGTITLATAGGQTTTINVTVQ